MARHCRLIVVVLLSAMGLLTSAGSATALPTWEFVGRDDSGARYYIDTDSWTWEDDDQTQVRFWLRGLNVKGYMPVRGRQPRSEISLHIIDCFRNVVHLGPATLYDSRGRVADSWNFWQRPKYIIPGSIAEAWRDYVCEDYDARQEW